MLLFEKRKNIPLIVVAASSTCRKYSTFANHQYRSRIADPILHMQKELREGIDYHLIYLSGIHGLVPVDAVIDPSPESVTHQTLKNVNDLSRKRAQAIIDAYQPSEIFLVMPHIYCEYFDCLLADISDMTIVHRPNESDDSIGELRLYLSLLLESFKQSSVRVHLKYSGPNKKSPCMTCLKVQIGDVVKCYINTTSGRDVFAEGIEVASIIQDRNMFIDTDGGHWDSQSIRIGLSAEEVEMAKEFGGPYAFGDDMSNITVTLKHVRESLLNKVKQEMHRKISDAS